MEDRGEAVAEGARGGEARGRCERRRSEGEMREAEKREGACSRRCVRRRNEGEVREAEKLGGGPRGGEARGRARRWRSE